MKLSPESWARERPQRYPMPVRHPDLPNFPPPMTANRAKDFESRQIAAAYADELDQFRPDEGKEVTI